MLKNKEMSAALAAALEFTPGYLTTQTPWHGLIPLGYWLARICRPAVVCELGVYRGDSFFMFHDASKNDSLKKIVAVDTWEGDHNTGKYGGGPFHQFLAERERRNDERIIYRKCYFSEAVSDFEDGSIDLLHIDGAHDYESVRDDYLSWKSKISSRGIVLFHDIAVKDNGFGVYQLWDEIKQDNPGRCLEVDFSNGLGILFLGRDAPCWVLDEGNREDLTLALLLLKRAGEMTRNVVSRERQVLESMGIAVGLDWVFGRYAQTQIDSIYRDEIAIGNWFNANRDDIYASLKDRITAGMDMGQWFQSRKDDIYEALKEKVQAELEYWLSQNVPAIFDQEAHSLKNGLQASMDDMVVRVMKLLDERLQKESRMVEEKTRSEIAAVRDDFGGRMSLALDEIEQVKRSIEESTWRFKFKAAATKVTEWFRA